MTSEAPPGDTHPRDSKESSSVLQSGTPTVVNPNLKPSNLDNLTRQALAVVEEERKLVDFTAQAQSPPSNAEHPPSKPLNLVEDMLDLPVVCNANRGTYHPSKSAIICSCSNCTVYPYDARRPLTPPEFTQHCGLEPATWRHAIHVQSADSITLSSLLEQHSGSAKPNPEPHPQPSHPHPHPTITDPSPAVSETHPPSQPTSNPVTPQASNTPESDHPTHPAHEPQPHNDHTDAHQSKPASPSHPRPNPSPQHPSDDPHPAESAPVSPAPAAPPSSPPPSAPPTSPASAAAPAGDSAQAAPNPTAAASLAKAEAHAAAAAHWLKSPKKEHRGPNSTVPGNRLGPSFQAEVPPMERQQDSEEEEVQGRVGQQAPPYEDALALASTVEKEAAEALPRDAIEDMDDHLGEASGERSGERNGSGRKQQGGDAKPGLLERSQRVRRLPQWLASSINPIAKSFTAGPITPPASRRSSEDAEATASDTSLPADDVGPSPRPQMSRPPSSNGPAIPGPPKRARSKRTRDEPAQVAESDARGGGGAGGGDEDHSDGELGSSRWESGKKSRLDLLGEAVGFLEKEEQKERTPRLVSWRIKPPERLEVTMAVNGLTFSGVLRPPAKRKTEDGEGDELGSLAPFPQRRRSSSDGGDRRLLPVRPMTCVLCHLHEDLTDLPPIPNDRCMIGGLGALVQTHIPGYSSGWVHKQCALWCAEVNQQGKELVGLGDAVRRARKTKCRECGRFGATINCMVRRCPNVYHLPCARGCGCLIINDPYKVACPHHLAYALPNTPPSGDASPIGPPTDPLPTPTDSSSRHFPPPSRTGSRPTSPKHSLSTADPYPADAPYPTRPPPVPRPFPPQPLDTTPAVHHDADDDTEPMDPSASGQPSPADSMDRAQSRSHRISSSSGFKPTYSDGPLMLLPPHAPPSSRKPPTPPSAMAPTRPQPLHPPPLPQSTTPPSRHLPSPHHHAPQQFLPSMMPPLLNPLAFANPAAAHMFKAATNPFVHAMPPKPIHQPMPQPVQSSNDPEMWLGGTTGQPGRAGRCAVCVIQRKGKCGTESAPKKCLRRQWQTLIHNQP